MPRVPLQVASESECGQNGMPVIISTRDIAYYDEGQCHTEEVGGSSVGLGKGLRILHLAYGEKKMQGLKPQACFENVSVSVLGRPGQCHKQDGLHNRNVLSYSA